MRSSQTHSLLVWGFPHRERPRLLHLMIGLAVSAFSYSVIWLGFRQVLAELLSQVLSSVGIQPEIILGSEFPALAIRLLDGSSLDLALTWQRSGLISIVIFGLLFIFVMFPLEGSLALKIAWLEFGFTVGLAWTIIRLLVGVLTAYHFGLGAFAVAEFLTGPFTDFFWIVSVWSIGLSALISARKKRV